MRTIALADRRPDTGVIDYIAINYALAGWVSYAEDLSPRDLRAAVHAGVDRGMSSRTIGELLLMHERQVDRFRADPCPTEDMVLAAKADAAYEAANAVLFTVAAIHEAAPHLLLAAA